MSDTRMLSLAETKEDEGNNAVLSFAEVSPYSCTESEIPSTVQVTLAKRILLAGSNRVLCLGAQTSVPINNDERASVSDLALRLSDGTNVALSLSFFNDDQGSIFQPNKVALGNNIAMARVPFEPLRYTARDESKLGLVLFAMALMALAGTYFVSPEPFRKVFNLATSHKLASASLGRSVQNPTKSTAHSKLAALAPAALVPTAISPALTKPAVTKVALTKSHLIKPAVTKTALTRFNDFAPSSRKSIQTNSYGYSKSANLTQHVSKSNRSMQPRSMFIPPPPPTDYAMPPANSPYWTLSTPAQSQHSVKDEQPASKVNSKRNEPSSLLAPKQTAAQDSRIKTESAPLPSVLDEALHAAAPAQNNESSLTGKSFFSDSSAVSLPNNGTHSEHIWESPVTQTNAPLPGNDSQSFERIVPPDQGKP